MPKSSSAPVINLLSQGWQVEIDADRRHKDETVPEEPIVKPGKSDHQTHDEGKGFLPTDHLLSSDSDGTSTIEPLQDRDAVGGDPGWQPLEGFMPTDIESESGDLTKDRWIAGRAPHATIPQQGRKSWQPLNDLTPESDDLVSILQDDFTINRGNYHLEDRGLTLTGSITESVKEMRPWDGEETQPISHQVDEVSLAETVLDTTFYLVPRQNKHFLLGELAQRLRKWLPSLCDIYGWQLDFLSVRPDYIKWKLSDFPECLTREMLGVVRRWTSERIFRIFPGLQSGNPTPDFWCPGYLVDTQNREFPTQVLIAHVSRKRSEVDSMVI